MFWCKYIPQGAIRGKYMLSWKRSCEKAAASDSPPAPSLVILHNKGNIVQDHKYPRMPRSLALRESCLRGTEAGATDWKLSVTVNQSQQTGPILLTMQQSRTLTLPILQKGKLRHCSQNYAATEYR